MNTAFESDHTRADLLRVISPMTISATIAYVAVFGATAFIIVSSLNSAQWATKAVGFAMASQFALLLLLQIAPANLRSRYMKTLIIAATLIGSVAGTLMAFGTRAAAGLKAQISNPEIFFLTPHDWLNTGGPLALCTIAALLIQFPARARTGRLGRLLLAARGEFARAATGSSSATDSKPGTESVVEDEKENSLVPAALLQHRAEQLQTANVFVLLLILAVLGASAWIVINAGRLVAEDTKPIDQIKEATARYDWAEKTLASMTQSIGELQAQVDRRTQEVNQIVTRDPVTKHGYTDAMRSLKVAEQALKDGIRSHDGLHQQLQQKRELIAKIEEDVLLRKQPTSNASETTGILVAAAATRLGVVVLAIYLVQILVSLYRYNAQLAAQYNALSDSLILGPASVSALAQALPHMRPTVAFGTTPQAITARIVAEAAKLLKGGDSNSRKQQD